MNTVVFPLGPKDGRPREKCGAPATVCSLPPEGASPPEVSVFVNPLGERVKVKRYTLILCTGCHEA